MNHISTYEAVLHIINLHANVLNNPFHIMKLFVEISNHSAQHEPYVDI